MCFRLWLLLLLLWMTGYPRPAAGQVALPGLRAFGRAEGLPQRQIDALCRTPDGFGWVGTSQGLCRFDGVRFERLGPPRPVLALAPDPAGGLWVGTPTGLWRLDRATGATLDLPRPDPGAGSGAPEQRIRALLVTRAGVLLAGSKAGHLLRYDAARRTFRRLLSLPVADPTNPPWIVGIAEGADGTLWLSTQHDGGIYACRPGPAPRRWPAGAPDATGGPAVVVADSAGGVLACLPDGTVWRAAAGQTLRPVAGLPPVNPAQPVRPVLAFGPGGGWLTRQTGELLRFDAATGRFGRRPLPELVVTRLAPDPRGGVWLGSTDGLFHFAEPAVRFRALLTRPPVESVRPAYSLRGLAELPGGRLLVGGYQGLLLLDSLGAVPRPLLADGARVTAYAVLPDSGGRGAWVGTEGRGLAWLDLRTGRYQFFTAAPDQRGPTAVRFIRVLAPDGRGHLWVGTYEGIFRFDPSRRRYRHLTDARFPEVGYFDTFVLSPRPDGTLWAGGQPGLIVLDTAGRVRWRLPTEALRPPVRALWFEPHSDVVWLGTAGGVGRLDARRRLHLIGPADGLSHPMVNALLPDAFGQLWVSTDDGLSVLQRATGRVLQTFLPPDGLSTAEFNHGSAAALRAGGLLFGSVDGLTVVRPRPAPPDPPAPLLLTRLTWHDGRAHRFRTRRFGLTPGTELVLGPGDESFSLDFALADFADPARHRFAYRLRGLETDWNYVGNRRALRYLRPPAGRYLLEIRAAGTSGRWQPPRVALRLRVEPPLYARWWFIVGCVVAGAGLLALVWRARLRRVRALEGLRIRLAADLHDEVGAWLTRVSLHTELARRPGLPPDRQRAQLEKAAEAGRQAIATMGDVVWAVDARNDSTAVLLGRMREVADALLTPAGIDYTFDTAGLTADEPMRPDVRQHVFLIFKEAVNNIVRHSVATWAQLCVGRRQGRLEVEVIDGGPARQPPVPGSGLGLRNMRMRAERLPGARLETGPIGAGYRVWLSVP